MSLGLAPKKVNQEPLQKKPAIVENGTSEEAKRLAAAALSAVRAATNAATAAAAAGRGKIEVSICLLPTLNATPFPVQVFCPFYE